jgi:tRNA-specific 2-thiouridylase
VIELQPAANTLVVGPPDLLSRDHLSAVGVNWVGPRPDGPLACTVKIRYTSPDFPAQVTPLADGGARVEFDQPVRGIAPGQAAVFYQAERVLGGGIISHA